MLLLANYMPSPLYIQNDKKEKYIRDFFYLFDPLINEFIEDIVLVNVKLFLEPSISNNKRKFFTFIIEFNYKLSKTEKMIDFVIESIDCPSANIFFLIIRFCQLFLTLLMDQTLLYSQSRTSIEN